MNMEFFRKLPIPKDIKEEYPASAAITATRERVIAEEKAILAGEDDRLLLVIGPCSADREDAVLEYVSRLAKLAERVRERVLILPRVYTTKPRTAGHGYKGMLHQPDPNGAPDLLRGIVAIRKLHMEVLAAGLGAADELLYPENHRYLSDLLCYVAVGARSVEDQQHRLVASGLDVPVGMKNPTGGNLSAMENAIRTANTGHTFLYRGWEVKSQGNPFAHGILRGYTDPCGVSHPNYGFETLENLAGRMDGTHPALLVDTNHENSHKDATRQEEIALDVMASRKKNADVRRLVRGFMVESYLEDGCQPISENEVYGRSITDPCLGWDATERLVLRLAEENA